MVVVRCKVSWIKMWLSIRNSLSSIFDRVSLFVSLTTIGYPESPRFRWLDLFQMSTMVSFLNMSAVCFKLFQFFKFSRRVLSKDIDCESKASIRRQFLKRSKSLGTLYGVAIKTSRVPISVEFPFKPEIVIKPVPCASALAWATDPYAELRAACCHALSLCAFRNTRSLDEEIARDSIRHVFAT